MIGLLGNVSLTGRHIAALLLLALALLLFLFLTMRIRAGRPPRIRHLPAFDDLPLELGHSAESGAPLHFALGSGGLGGSHTLTSIASLEVLEQLAEVATAYGTPPIVTVGDPTLLPLAQDTLRRAYQRQGKPQRFDPAAVRFVTHEPISYAAGTADTTAHENVHASVAMGLFEEEVSLLSHAGASLNMPQMTAVDRLRALGALYPTATKLAAGEELYAGPARLVKSPRHLASLRVQDILRFLLVGALLLKVLGLF